MYPRITVSLIEGTDAEVCEWVEKDIIDLGLTGETTPAVQPIVIMEDEFVVVVASDHRLASRGQISLTDAADEPFLMSASGCEPAIRQIFDQAKINPPIVLRVRDAEALVNMVSQDIGITIMPQLAIPADSRAIAQISIKPRRRRQVFAITRSGAPKVPAAERLKAMLSNTKG